MVERRPQQRSIENCARNDKGVSHEGDDVAVKWEEGEVQGGIAYAGVGLENAVEAENGDYYEEGLLPIWVGRLVDITGV